MATVVKWFASLMVALGLGLSGEGASASTNQALVEVGCVHLEAPADAWIKSGDFASFRIEADADILFAPGEKAHAQGLYLMSELARSEITCKVDGTPVTLRVVGYRSMQNSCYEDSYSENYQLELWIDGEVTLRTAPAEKEDHCDAWILPFSGVISVNAQNLVSGRATVCMDELSGIGHFARPPFEDPVAMEEWEKEYREAEWRNKHTRQPFGLFLTAIYQRSCG